jgi:ketosteroid isomerase-like protein
MHASRWKYAVVVSLGLLFTVVCLAGVETAANPTAEDSLTGASADAQKKVANLDTEYQAAVRRGDVAAMDRLLADDFVLVTGSGKVYHKSDLLQEARNSQMKYERQEDSEQTVRVWGQTAVVSAKLWAKGSENGKPFEYMLWFSDTYAYTPRGWKYVFGQSSLPLPNATAQK